MTPGDIVFILWEGNPLDGMLAVVEEARSWGVIAYVQFPKGETAIPEGEITRRVVFMLDTHRAYIRLGPENYLATGGSIIPKEKRP